MSINRTLLANYLQGTQDPAKRNYILNHSAFKDLSNINAVGATVVRNTTAPLTAISDIQATFTGASQYVDVLGTALDRAIRGTNCELRFNYKLNLGTGANVEVHVRQGASTLIAQQSLLNTSDPQQVSVNFPCGNTSDEYSIRFIQSSGSSTSVLNVANIYLGQATNVGTVAQAEFVGVIKISNCSSAWTTTSSSYTDFSPLTTCSYFIDGSGLQQPTSNLPGFILNGPPGNYVFVYSGLLFDISAGNACRARVVSNSLSSYEDNFMGEVSANFNLTESSFSIKFTQPLVNEFIRLQQRRQTGTANCRTYASSLYDPLTIKIYRFPIRPEIAYRPEQQQNFAAIKFPAASGCSWTTSSTSFTDFAPVAACPTPSGSDLIGKAEAPATKVPRMIVKNVPPGVYYVGANIVRADNSGAADTRIIDSLGNVIAYNSTFPGNGSGQFGGYVVYDSFQPQIEFKIQGSVSSGTMNLRNDSSWFPGLAGTAGITIFMHPVSQSLPAPNLIGSITSTSTDSFREVSFAFGGASFNSVCSSSPCTIYNQTGGVASVTRTGAGDYTISFDSNLFKSQPVCTFTPSSSGSVVASTRTSFTLDNTTYRVITEDLSGTPTDSFVLARCVGPRGSL